VDQEEVDAVDRLALLVTWSTVVEIPYVTVYDASGFIRARHEEKLLGEVKKCLQALKSNGPPSLPEYGVSLVQLQPRDGEYDKNAKETPAAPKPAAYHSEVLLLSAKEGRWAIINSAKSFCQAVEKGHANPQDITHENFRENLGAVPNGWPDPDLVVKLGNDTIVNAFLPWHIRLAEIVAAGPLRGISLPQFLSSLSHYGRVQQRFGA